MAQPPRDLEQNGPGVPTSRPSRVVFRCWKDPISFHRRKKHTTLAVLPCREIVTKPSIGFFRSDQKDSYCGMNMKHVWMGLEINWEKTWLWSTSSTGVAKLKSAIQDIVPTEVLQTQVHATDLGCQMTYHGTAKMGILHNRLALAKQRLETLKHCTWALPLKIHVVITCILPLALYGAELLAIGQKHLSSLRSQIADALVGENVPSMSSSIFLHCATFHDLDPHIVVLFKAIKAAKKYLTCASQDAQAKFFKTMSQPVETSGLSKGPASALREYLQRKGLRCSPDGMIQITA